MYVRLSVNACVCLCVCVFVYLVVCENDRDKMICSSIPISLFSAMYHKLLLLWLFYIDVALNNRRIRTNVK